MIYENAKRIANGLSISAYEVIEDSLRDLPKEEFNKIPIIDPHTKIVAEKYGICFSHNFRGDYANCWNMYIICSCVFREEKPYNLK